MSNPLCPCCSGNTYTNCCEPYLQQQIKPSTAEQLMRSRFTAFSQRNADYLINTLHPSQRKTDELRQLQESFQHTHWFKLVITETIPNTLNDNHASVTFIASFKEDNQFYDLHEHSVFLKEGAHWYYLNGATRIEPFVLHIKRNDVCWCGSGIKFKKCHGI